MTTYTEWDTGYEYEDVIRHGVSVIKSIVRAMPNLKTLSLPITTILYNINEMREFIAVVMSNSLEELVVENFKLAHDMSATDDFVETIRLLSDRLKAYLLTFTSVDDRYWKAMEDILSNEFKIRPYNDEYHEDEDGASTSYFLTFICVKEI